MAFSTSLRAAGAIQRRAEAADERRALVDRLRADLEGVWLRPQSDTTWFRGLDAGTTPGSGATGEGDVLELTTARPVSLEAVRADEGAEGAAGPQSDVAQVSWRLELSGEGVPVLVRWERTPPDPDYLQNEQQVDPAQDPAFVRTVISRSVTGFNLRFFDGTEWLDEWDSAPETDGTTDGTTEEDAELPPPGLPRAVEVTLFLGNGQTPDPPQRLTRLAAPDEEPALTLIVALPVPTEPAEAEEVTP